ncbi:2-oxoacid:ferredoxin oxidoreductase subunit beta [Candidatus Hecatella orcuttiae]|jgi:2-oxoglutarate ferredoxin oxidoreductase subunit beta|uniref:2-oxoacid:ferredoxin oxidoreductase subunit beta n=1 Tax=Candidatus Hecatella orcuttiae TaxID=1935119 RepID=UPI002867B816|nr:2-oxoacid:ferredoxin oxidoreductase subunit beta [Candidatus Hecatella orcuttiae]
MVKLEDYRGGETAWCPGCGNFGILTALKKALVDLGIAPYEVLIVSGIGQAGKLPHYMKCNTFNGLHGRTLPVATAAKLANHRLHVFAVGGDGDGYGEGGNHLIHTIRRNVGVKYLVHNNQIYGLTKGQASPTSDLGFVTKTTPRGVVAPPLNPIALALALGASFVARSFSGDIPHLVHVLKEAIRHRGFALVDILQPCVTFNYLNTFAWYRKRIYKLEEEKTYDSADRFSAFKKAQEWGDRIPVGVFYKEGRPTFEEQFPALKDGPLVKQKIELQRLEGLMEEFT